jgi:hypothetical protein
VRLVQRVLLELPAQQDLSDQLLQSQAQLVQQEVLVQQDQQAHKALKVTLETLALQVQLVLKV